MHDVTMECVAAVTDHSPMLFFRENVARVYMTLWRRNDVRNLTLTPFCFVMAMLYTRAGTSLTKPSWPSTKLS